MKKIFLGAAFLLVASQFILAQSPPPPAQIGAPSPKISVALIKNLDQLGDKTEISREHREEAFTKLLEGQRYIWNIWRDSRPHSQSVVLYNALLASRSLQKAVQLNPYLAEGYTALAELMKNAPPYDVDESIALAGIATRIDKNNFGGHYVLAQLYTFKSELNRGILDPNYMQMAINEWREIARLDSRNAEAYAFLSEFYARTNKPDERIAALRNWIASTPPLSGSFYSRIFQRQSLAPESASLKLGEALTKAKRNGEAIEILSRSVADDPDNNDAVELLRVAIESADETSAATAVQALRQAAYANQENAPLILLLAQTEARTGKIDEAAKVLRDASAKIADKDKSAAANLQIALGDLFVGKNLFSDAAQAFQSALATRGIGDALSVSEDERDFAIRTFEKLIDAFKKSDRPAEVRATIERARRVLGKADLFADKF